MRRAADFARLGSAAHRALAREAVRKSLVLLKNDHHTLPLNPRARILVAGDAADSIGMQSGGWTLDWQGDHNSNADFPGATSIFGGIRAAVAAAGGTAVLSKDGRIAEKPDAAVVVFGEGPYAEFQGDRENLEYSPNDAHELELLRRLHASGVPTVAVFLSGRPMWVNPQINASDAFVAAWLPGSEGEGVADVLFSAAGREQYDFTGRLAFSWPRTAMPVTLRCGRECIRRTISARLGSRLSQHGRFAAAVGRSAHTAALGGPTWKPVPSGARHRALVHFRRR